MKIDWSYSCILNLHFSIYIVCIASKSITLSRVNTLHASTIRANYIYRRILSITNRKKKVQRQQKNPCASHSHTHLMASIATSRKKNIYFSRHGERIDWIDTTWILSAKRRCDPPLSPYGLEQAHELGVYIAELQPRITHIYASPFLRTIQTALQVANQMNKNVLSITEITKIRLEPGFGEYFLDHIWNEENIYQSLHQLREISQNIEYFDQDYDSVIKADYYLRTKVETRQQLRDRLKQVLQCTLEAHTPDCNILIITHAAPLIEGVRALLTSTGNQNVEVIKKEEIEITTNQDKSNLSAWDMSPIRASVCSLTHLELTDDKWTLSKNGLFSYLSKGERNPWIFPDDKSLYKTS